MPDSPPPSPPLPSPPPITFILFTVIIAGDVSSFDETSYKTNLANQLGGISPAAISLDVGTASVRVATTIRVVDPTMVDAVLGTLTNLAASPATLSSALDVSVEAIETAPTLSSVANTIDPDALATEGRPSDSGGGVVIVAAGAGGAIFLLVVLVFALRRVRCCRQRRKAGQSTARDGDLKVIEISTTDGAAPTATDPERASDGMDTWMSNTHGNTAGSASLGSVRLQRARENMSEWEWASKDLVWGDRLGSGSFGAVYRVQHAEITLAAKRMNVSKDEAAEREELENELVREFRALHKVSHANIVQLLGVITDNQSYVCLLMELADGGSLRQMLDARPERVVEKPLMQVSLAHDVASGLAYCHALKPQPLLHHDIKSANILLFADETSPTGLTAKLADFGLAVGVSGESTMAATARTKTHAAGGTMAYRGPETFSGKYTTASEVYSFSIVLWELLTGERPWHRDAAGRPYTEANLVYMITVQNKRPNVPKKGGALLALMKRCWSTQPKKRPSFEDILKVLAPLVPHQSRASSAILSEAQPARTAPYAAAAPDGAHHDEDAEDAEVTDELGEHVTVDFGTLDKEPAVLRLGMSLHDREQAVCEAAAIATVSATFGPGPMGLTLRDVNGDVMITQVEAGSQAEQQGLVADLVIFQVAGQSVRGMHRAAVMERIKGAERPVTFVFESQATAKLAAKLEELRGVQERLRDERCQRDDAVPKCRAAVEAGRTCAVLYESAFNMLLTGEPADGLGKYNRSAAALRANIPQPIQCEQATKDLATLYTEAGAVRMRARKVMEGLGAHTNAKLEPMGPLKRTRCVRLARACASGTRARIYSRSTPHLHPTRAVPSPNAAARARRWCWRPTVQAAPRRSATSCVTCSFARIWERWRG